MRIQQVWVGVIAGQRKRLLGLAAELCARDVARPQVTSGPGARRIAVRLFEQVAGRSARTAPGVFCRGQPGRVYRRVDVGTCRTERTQRRGFARRVSTQARRRGVPAGAVAGRRRSPGPGACSGHPGTVPGLRAGPGPRPSRERDASGRGCWYWPTGKFLSWALAREFLATGAHILWRASAAFTLKPVKVLADGTYLAGH